MKPFQAILRKESRQQGALALCMLLFCFILQLGTVMMQVFTPSLNPDYLSIGLFVTALFAGATAAISFSSEKDDRTFAFLRSLPVSARTVMLGKTAWILSGTVAVLAGTLLLAVFWYTVTSWHNGIGAEAAFALFGVGILESLAWGMFWSPRCRSQIVALLATYSCASLSGYAAACFFAVDSGAVVQAYVNAVPLRLGTTALVAVFAAWGMSRWFEFSVQKAGQKTPQDRGRFGVLPFPKRLQSPFFSLLHQSVRQSQTFMLLGIGILIVLIGCCYMIFQLSVHRRSFDVFELIVPGILFGLFYLIFCGSIFGMDQKNESYRFLGRCGVVPGKVWWSRIVPFFMLVLPMAVFMAVLLGNLSMRDNALGPIEALLPYRVSLPFLLVFMLIPFSVGSFMSISLRSPIVAVTLTGTVSILVYFWMLIGVNGFDFNPLWSTMPICAAFLTASRIRCGDWLRERRTWRSRWKAAAPVAVTFAVICIAIPPIRVYSVPYISMDELEKQFVWNSVRKDRDSSTPELRKVKFDEMRQRLSLMPPTDSLGYTHDGFLGVPHQYYRSMDELNTARRDRIIPRQEDYLKSYCKILEQYDNTSETYDFRLLKLYEMDYRWYANVPFYLPWERARYLRRINEAIVFALRYDDTQGREWEEYHFTWNAFFAPNIRGTFNAYSWSWMHAAPQGFYRQARGSRLVLVKNALHVWYLEHGDKLPDTLDELVEAGYLKQIPVDPETGRRPEYISAEAWHLKLGDQKADLFFAR